MAPYNPPSVMAKPPSPVPIAESENPDVIALRASMGILQVQHMTAKKDMERLQKMKDEALKDPEAYVKALVERMNTQSSEKGANLLTPTVQNLVSALGKKSDVVKGLDEKKDGNEDVKMATSTEEAAEKDSDDESSEPPERFPVPPSAQNVYRMPPINWAKYQVVGDVLDLMHDDQRNRPIPGMPDGIDSDRTEDYNAAAPYQPVVDAARLARIIPGQNGNGYMGNSGDHPMVTRRSAKRASR
jgi:hypothetical protein